MFDIPLDHVTVLAEQDFESQEFAWWGKGSV